jgi:ATP adenylyltransferase
MEGQNLFAPWRMQYIRSLEKPADDRCFICDAVAATTDQQRRDRLVLWTSPQCIILMNRFPYTNGHILIAPRAHKAELDELSADEHLDLQVQTTEVVRLLRRALSAQGFNIGMNLGRCAGAGLPGHLHQHIVPRWGGDTNFMSVVGEVRVVPQALSAMWQDLMRARTSTSAPVTVQAARP